MEQLITHACGHQQGHLLTGYPSQQERRAQWLRTTDCRACFVAGKRAGEAAAAAGEEAVVAELGLPPLTGSERQVAWATTIRARRLAAMLAEDCRPLIAVTDAKWWIDRRDLPEGDLLAAVVAPVMRAA